MEKSWNETLIVELDYKKPAFYFLKKHFYSKALQDIPVLSIIVNHAFFLVEL